MRINSIKIKLRMAELEMTQTDLAEMAGASRQNISLILSRGTCSIINAGKIAKALGVDVTEIIKEE